MALREANMTAAEKQARAEETRRGQILFSRIVPENHPDWRLQENSNLAFYREQITPLEKVNRKSRLSRIFSNSLYIIFSYTPIYRAGNSGGYRARVCEN